MHVKINIHTVGSRNKSTVKLIYKDVISVALIVVAIVENWKQPVCSSIEE